ncbi:hypothetical protein AIOGIFDO_00200 [Candidatus Methanoperedenaceae archaeon GB37]|nr:hypothetical protein AIOGIFDO_00200 [Candidatus Methanoperedenaceae archaeon GB37]
MIMNKVYILPVVLLVALVVCSAAVSAEYCEDLNTKINGTVHGGVYVGGGHGSDGNGPIDKDPWTPYEQDFSVPSGTIKWARLYTGVWASGNSDGWINITFYNGTGYTSHNAYVSTGYTGGDNDEEDGYYVACGYGNYWYYWNVTDIVRNGFNNASVATNGFDVGTVHGVSLVVVYDDGGDEITYWINQGLVYLGTGDTTCSCRRAESTTWFNGTMPTTQNATLWTEYFVAEPSPENDYLEFNGYNFTLLGVADTADGGGTTPDATWTNARLDIDKWVIDKDWIDPSSNSLRFIRGSDTATRAVLAVFLSKPPAPDLKVSEIDTLVERDGQTPMALVANHTYTINATILNAGNLDAGGFNVTLEEDGALKNDTGLTGLDAGSERIVQFDWSNLSGSYSLKVTADAYNTVTESDETNNESTAPVTVYPDTGLADLAINSDDITFHPAHANHAANNKTIVRVKVRNEGTADAGSPGSVFKVQLTTGATSIDKTTWLRAKCYRFVEFEVSLPDGSNSVTVTLDPDGNITESSTANNVASESVNIIPCRILDTHEYGDNSTYNGPLSGYTDVEMFDVVKLAPEGTSPVELLKSVAITTEEGASTPIKSIDGLEQSSTLRYYWYPFVNGIPIPWGDWETYPLHAGDTIHWDILKWVNSPSPDSYKARPIQDYPEPFLHGYNGTIYNTTIVYPDELCYPAKADAIESRLLAAGVPADRISKKAVGALTQAEKQNNNLILIGTPSNNPIIAELNARHADVGMPVYFNGSQMTDDYDDTTWVGGVIEACDNPYDNGWTDAWKDTGPSIWLAAAVEDYWAYKAAEMLASDSFDRFWKNRKPYLTPIWDGTNVTLDWSNWTGTCTSFDIYITENLTAGFPATPNVTGVTGTSWTDTNAGASNQRYYKVTCNTTGEQIEGNVTKITYELEKRGSKGINWITPPSTNPPLTNADELIKAIPNHENVKWWNSTSQLLESYSKMPWGYVGDNFEVKPTRGYEAVVNANTIWTVVGWVPPDCPIGLKKIGTKGINWIGMPFNTTIDDADELIKAIPNHENVKWWNSTSQLLESYSKMPWGYVGDNFEVKPTRGYEAVVNANTIWTPR